MFRHRIACRLRGLLTAGLAGLGLLASCAPLPEPVDRFEPKFAEKSFVNWENPHVSPLALSRDGTRLYAVNTAGAQLEIFDVSGAAPRHATSIAVGLDPVSVRLRSDTEAWVVNHVSDSVSIVDLQRGRVIRTLHTDDEPADVAFAGGRAFVVCSQANTVLAFYLNDLERAPRRLLIEGEDPRAIAVSPDGRRVYVTIFESGNHTTLIPWEDVSNPDGPYFGVNPPPNAGLGFAPALNPANPPSPPHSLIVRKDAASGEWRDDNGHDWSQFVTWDLHDHDLAIIEADSLALSYAANLLTTNMHLAVMPDGSVIVVGTEADNTRRFEPNLTGRFIRSQAALVAPNGDGASARIDLNPHLADAYERGLPRVAQALRDRSVADPRGVVVDPASRGWYVSGMGSNLVAAFDADGRRRGQVDVGAGPTGLALDPAGGRLFVLNKFDGSISQVDTAGLSETARVAFFDPTPAAIRNGRPFLYDARRFSGLGVTSCGACHLDGRTDQLAWDLGDPAGAMKGFNQACNHPFFGLPVGECEDWHPLKGPMTTQTLQGIVGAEPLHWRGDREDLAAFNPAFVGLLGADRELTAAEMQAFEDFIATLQFAPPPTREADHRLRTVLGDGSPPIGEEIYFQGSIDLSLVQCNDCHTLTGDVSTNHKVTPRELLIIPHQSIDVPQIRNMIEKRGFSKTSQRNNLGFGHNHDGNVDGLVNFFHIPNFTGFSDGEKGEQERRDLISFVFSIGSDVHAGAGLQVTLGGDGTNVRRDPHADPADLVARMLDLAEQESGVGLVVRGEYEGETRGFTYVGGGRFQSDRAGQIVTAGDLRTAGESGAGLTWMLTPGGSQTRLGIDQDLDGVLNGDE